MLTHPVHPWHQLVKITRRAAPDALPGRRRGFHSPVVHTPQVGKAITRKYLAAAFQVFFNESFRYVRELTGERDAILEFQVEIDGIQVNGVDMIKWNEHGKIVEFKVMLRPLKAVNLIHQKMGAMLAGGPVTQQAPSSTSHTARTCWRSDCASACLRLASSDQQLQGHTLRWHKSGQDASGMRCLCNGRRDTVHGVLYELPLAEAASAPGLGARYDEDLRILTPSGRVRPIYATHRSGPGSLRLVQGTGVAGARQNARRPST
jgi:hypothetical protein